MSTPAESLDADATLVPTGVVGRVVEEEPAEALPPGMHVGRHVVLRKLGAGGMGRVYLAYDPQLDRKVAIKLLRGRRGGVDPLALRREAQAMAKLQHPNVVTVHDVGEHEGRVYVAMEVVEGRTLRDWLRAEPRRWREVVEHFVPAGRGLAAAHARGLVHRDFKPDNVMVSDEGRVLVMDFGLARVGGELGSDTSDVDVRSFGGSVLDAATVGRLVGTPAYMAPEQVLAKTLTPAVDQFAFCVSLWEGVCGERPFEGQVVAELFANASEGRIRPPPAGRLPGWLRRVLLRGLAPEPEARWPSMTALLDALERGRRRGRWPARVLTVAGLVAAVGGTWGWQQQRERQRAQALAACESEGAVIGKVWNEEARERVRAGMLATGARFAPHSLEILMPWLDDYRDAWSEGRTQACVHATIERDWDEERQERSAWCFEDRRLQLEATVDQIATLSRASARRAVRLASYLDPVDSCLDPNVLQRLPAPPLEVRDEIRAIRFMLGQSDRLRHEGQFGEALDVAVRARQRADALGWSPLQALVRFIEGRCSFEAGRPAQAEQILVRAYFEGQDAGSLEVAFRSARTLVIVYEALQRFAEAEVWSRHADVLSAVLEDPSGLDEAEGHYLMSLVRAGQHDYETAAIEGEKALELRKRALGAEHPITAAATRNLGNVYLAQGRYREALARLEEAWVIWEDAVGHEHPYVGGLALARGRAHWELGQVDEAIALHREGLSIYQQVLRVDHPRTLEAFDTLGRALLELGRVDEAEPMLQRVLDTTTQLGAREPAFAEALLGMALVDVARGRHEQALARCERALEILERVLGSQHPDVAVALDRVADVDRALGRFDDAVARRREALERREAVLGVDHRQLVTPLVALGDAQQQTGQRDSARQSYARALAIGESRLGADDAALVPILTGLSEVALAQGDLDAARRYSERAVRISEAQHAGPRGAAAAHFALARARGDGSGRALAEQAEREYATCRDAARRAEVQRWLAEHPASP